MMLLFSYCLGANSKFCSLISDAFKSIIYFVVLGIGKDPWQGSLDLLYLLLSMPSITNLQIKVTYTFRTSFNLLQSLLGLMHEMHTDPKSEVDLDCQSDSQSL